MAEKLKASAMIAELRKHVGDGYVYGSVGQECTLALLQAKQRQYGASMGNGYYQLNGDYNKGDCARWLGKWVADCSGLIKAVRKALTGVWRDVSAQGTYDQCPVTARGPIRSLPLMPGCTVYMWSTTKKRMGHVGMYIGNGLVVEARGVKYGVVITKLAGRAWTHWGMLDYIDHDLPQEGEPQAPGGKPETDAGDSTNGKPDDIFDPEHVPYLDQGDKGDLVAYMQYLLAQRGYKLPKSVKIGGKYGYDGDWGDETEKEFARFQRDNKAKVKYLDTVCGPLCWSVLTGTKCK